MIAHVIVEQRANESFQSKQKHLKQQGFCFTGETFFILLHVNIILPYGDATSTVLPRKTQKYKAIFLS